MEHRHPRQVPAMNPVGMGDREPQPFEFAVEYHFISGDGMGVAWRGPPPRAEKDRIEDPEGIVL